MLPVLFHYLPKETKTESMKSDLNSSNEMRILYLCTNFKQNLAAAAATAMMMLLQTGAQGQKGLGQEA